MVSNHDGEFGGNDKMLLLAVFGMSMTDKNISAMLKINCKNTVC